MLRRTFHIHPFIVLLVLAVFLVILFYLLKGLLYILYYGSPLFLIGVIILDYKILIGHVKKLIYRIKHEPLNGILVLMLNIVGFPFVLAWLFGLALFRRKIRQVEKEIHQRREDEFTDFEIIEESTGELPQKS
jgi:hypothetical protein